jgi:hypothetical protein
MKAQRESRGKLYYFFNLGARWRWMVNATLGPLYPRKRQQVPIVYDTGWAPGSVWTGAENTASTGIRFPNRPVRSKSLYRLSYLGPFH